MSSKGTFAPRGIGTSAAAGRPGHLSFGKQTRAQQYENLQESGEFHETWLVAVDDILRVKQSFNSTVNAPYNSR